MLKMILLSLGSGEAPLLDIVAYAGYTFTGMCFAVLGKILSGYSSYILMPCACLCMEFSWWRQWREYFLQRWGALILADTIISFSSSHWFSSHFLHGLAMLVSIGFSKLLCYVVETCICRVMKYQFFLVY